jgi:hypothetical protein
MADVTAFEQGATGGVIPPEETFSTTVAFDLELLPAYTASSYGSGTTGKAAIATNGVGLQLSIDPTTIDITFLQLEPPELKGMKDALDTIDFTVKMTGDNPQTPPQLEFAITLVGGGETHQICFRDTMDKVEAMLGPLERRLQEVTPTTSNATVNVNATAPAAATTCADDLTWVDSYGDSCGWYAAHDPGCTYYSPAPSYGQFDHCPLTCGLCTPPPPPPGACLDDATWTDSYGDSCAWYAYNDPGCTSYGDYGQFGKCKATCNTCNSGPDSFCPIEPVITVDGSTETIEYCLPAEEHFAVFGPGGEEEPFTSHTVTSIKATFSRTDETDATLDFSFTGPDSPEFELKGQMGLTEILAPSPDMPTELVMPACPTWLDVAALMPEEQATTTEYQQGHYCDYTSPEVEPCCSETSYAAQDACLAAHGSGTHLCDHTDPTIETCCQETTYEAQDACLANKAVTYRRLAADKSKANSLDATTSKKIALQTLKKLHGAHRTGKKLFQQYKDEKERLVRKTIIEYGVVAFFALIFAGGAWRYLPSIRKRYEVAPTDEDVHVEGGLAAQTE